MANGNMLTILREMSERNKVNPETALPFVFQGIADIIDMIGDMKKENHEYREKREREEKERKEAVDIKIGACEDRLQALETRKDIRVALIGGGGAVLGAIVTGLVAIIVASG